MSELIHSKQVILTSPGRAPSKVGSLAAMAIFADLLTGHGATAFVLWCGVLQLHHAADSARSLITGLPLSQLFSDCLVAVLDCSHGYNWGNWAYVVLFIVTVIRCKLLATYGFNFVVAL